VASAGEYWTSGSDSGCEGVFGWCAVNKLVRDKEAKWAPGQPDDKNSAENCVSVNMANDSVLLSDSDCAKKLNYVCETRDTRNAISSPEAMIDECAAAFNVTRGTFVNFCCASFKNYFLQLKRSKF